MASQSLAGALGLSRSPSLDSPTSHKQAAALLEIRSFSLREKPLDRSSQPAPRLSLWHTARFTLRPLCRRRRLLHRRRCHHRRQTRRLRHLRHLPLLLRHQVHPVRRLARVSTSTRSRAPMVGRLRPSSFRSPTLPCCQTCHPRETTSFAWSTNVPSFCSIHRQNTLAALWRRGGPRSVRVSWQTTSAWYREQWTVPWMASLRASSVAAQTTTTHLTPFLPMASPSSTTSGFLIVRQTRRSSTSTVPRCKVQAILTQYLLEHSATQPTPTATVRLALEFALASQLYC